MRGSAQQPVPGVNSDRVPTAITDVNNDQAKPKRYVTDKPKYTPERPATRMESAPRALKIFKKDVEKYDLTPGCRACTEVITGRDQQRHAITQNIPHSADCRARMIELMRQDEVDRTRVEKAEGRQARFKELPSSSSRQLLAAPVSSRQHLAVRISLIFIDFQ